MPAVSILIGSKSDQEVMKACEDYLVYFGIDYELKILSAHRNPVECVDYVHSSETNGVKIFIAAAGMAAHLPGVVASHTTLPVIGVPLSGSELNGVDALYSIVQMPAGIPVATVAIGKAGAKNAAVLAAEILALQNSGIKLRLKEFRKNGSKI
jgi:phosphoribosylaminoimidazole carboxylase PurE protein